MLRSYRSLFNLLIAAVVVYTIDRLFGSAAAGTGVIFATLATAGGLGSFDQTSSEFLDLEDVLNAVLLADNFLAGRIAQGPKAIETTHKWPEDTLNSPTVTGLSSDTALDAAGTDTDLVLASGQGALLRVGALLKDTAAGQSEVIQVTAISTDTLTIVRGYGSTDPQAHLQAAVFRIISQPKQENDTGITDRSVARTVVSNYTQIFKYEVEISGTVQAVKQAGVAPGGELSLQIQRRTMELMRELGATYYHGISSASVGSDTVYRTMEGIREFLMQSGGNSRTGSEALDEVVANRLYRDSWDDGGDPSMLAGAAVQIAAFGRLQADKIRLAPSDRMRGYFAEHFLTDVGRELELLVDRWMPVDEVACLDLTKIARHDLRSFRMEPLAKVGDGERAQILYEGTMSVKNAKQAHSIHTNLIVAS